MKTDDLFNDTGQRYRKAFNIKYFYCDGPVQQPDACYEKKLWLDYAIQFPYDVP